MVVIQRSLLPTTSRQLSICIIDGERIGYSFDPYHPLVVVSLEFHVVLAQVLPPDVPIDLSNVCFDKGRSPDRLAAINAVQELSRWVELTRKCNIGR